MNGLEDIFLYVEAMPSFLWIVVTFYSFTELFT